MRERGQKTERTECWERLIKMALCLAEGKSSFPVLTIKKKKMLSWIIFKVWTHNKLYDNNIDKDLFYGEDS